MSEPTPVDMEVRRFDLLRQIAARANTGQHATYECEVNFFEPGPHTNQEKVQAWIELCADILGVIITLEDGS